MHILFINTCDDLDGVFFVCLSGIVNGYEVDFIVSCLITDIYQSSLVQGMD